MTVPGAARGHSAYTAFLILAASHLLHKDIGMRALMVSLSLVGLLSGCISSSNPPPPAKTTVVVPANSGTTVICQDGTKPPCN